jgi:hypothetical protein
MLAWAMMVLALQMGNGEVRAVWHMGYWDTHHHHHTDQALPVVGPRLARSEYQKPKPRFVFGLGKRSGGLGGDGEDWALAEVRHQLDMIVSGLERRMMQRDG